MKLDTTLKDLQLWHTEIDITCVGNDLIHLFDENHLLPGIMITQRGNYIGVISRTNFFNLMSRPYSLGLYAQRSIELLYKKLQVEEFLLPEEMLVVTATNKALQRPTQSVYEPIVVAGENGSYRVLDFHQLILANSQIHSLTLAQLQQAEENSLTVETDLRSLQDNYSRSLHNEKMLSLGKLVAGIAHEINNPLNFIDGNVSYAAEYTQNLIQLVQLYQKHYPQPIEDITILQEEIDLEIILQDFPKVLSSIETGANRIKYIVLSLRNFSRLDESELKEINIHEGIDNSLLILQSHLRSQTNLEINVVKEYADLPLVKCYAKQLNQAFYNILSNAFDALEDKANHCKTQVGMYPQLTIQLKTQLIDKKYVEVQIIDNGFGINQEIRDKIFDPFFTTKPVGKGTGMGLSICHQIIVEKHNGNIECFSTPGLGTKFMIQIPQNTQAKDSKPS